MKAIVLTCDQYLPLTNHMIHKYQQLWPNNPFCFRIPYQNYPKHLKEKYKNKIELVHSESSIIQTINTLLADLHDEDWIYWCIDDKYPIHLNVNKIAKIYNWVKQDKDSEISGIIFSRVRKLSRTSNLFKNKYIMSKKESIFDNTGNKYLRRKDYNQIWIHQFLKVKVIRYLFESFPSNIFYAKEMDYLKEKITLPDSHKLYVTNKNLALFGESTTRGKLTKNCAKSFQKLGLELPNFFDISNDKIIIK